MQIVLTFLTRLLSVFLGQECGIHSQQKCYPLAFGVPAALMAVALGKLCTFKWFKLGKINKKKNI